MRYVDGESKTRVRDITVETSTLKVMRGSASQQGGTVTSSPHPYYTLITDRGATPFLGHASSCQRPVQSKWYAGEGVHSCPRVPPATSALKENTAEVEPARGASLGR